MWFAIDELTAASTVIIVETVLFGVSVFCPPIAAVMIGAQDLCETRPG